MQMLEPRSFWLCLRRWWRKHFRALGQRKLICKKRVGEDLGLRAPSSDSSETNVKEGGLTNDGTREPDTAFVTPVLVEPEPDHPTALEPRRLLEAFEANGFKVFKGPWNLNLFGIRTGLEAGKWDDWIGALYQDEEEHWHIDLYQGTTDPSDHALEQGYDAKGGTAILKEGQHRSCWVRGLHRGSYPALVQHGGKVTVIRDNTKDSKLDFDYENNPNVKVDTGYFGINLHRASAHRAVSSIGLYSRGCQVICDPGDFLSMMDLIDKSADIYGESFSYSLFRWPLPKKDPAVS